MKIVLIGYGFIGEHLSKELSITDIYDKYKNIDTRQHEIYDIAWIAVPTPYDTNDVSEIITAFKETQANIYVIKSTVLPQNIPYLNTQTTATIIYSPEFYGKSKDSTTFTQDYTILGGDRSTCDKVIMSIQKYYNGNYRYIVTSQEMAMLVKYMSNAFLLTKQTFCNEFYKIATDIGLSYNELRELFILDSRFTGVRTTVNPDELRLNHHCHSKDVPAIADATDNEFLKFIASYHERSKS